MDAERYALLLLPIRFGHSLTLGGHAVRVSAQFALDAETRTAALSAAGWLPAFHQHITLAITDDAVELQSDRYNSDELAAIWTTAVVNEALLARGRDGRQAAFEALAR